MKNVSYLDIPSKSQFQTDSSVTFAFRSSDRILSHLDWLLDRYAHWMKKSDFYSMRRVILADLFLTCNYWIKGYHDIFN